MRKVFILLTFLASTFGFSQELNCTVTVISQQTGNENNVVFKTLEKQLTEFINTTKWTEKPFAQQERINCSMIINVKDYENDSFSATLQIASSRPIFNSVYSSPVYNFNDKNFNFQYLEFQNLIFNPLQFESNLVSVLSFHVYMILGLDADTFKHNGGDIYFKQAQTITNYSQQLAGQGWALQDGIQSRFVLIDNILSPTYKAIRSTLYKYHIEGLDLMSSDLTAGKEAVVSALLDLNLTHKKRPNSFLMRIFFDAKSNEISDILSGGPKVKTTEVFEVLKTVAPLHSQKWAKLKY